MTGLPPVLGKPVFAVAGLVGLLGGAPATAGDQQRAYVTQEELQALSERIEHQRQQLETQQRLINLQARELAAQRKAYQQYSRPVSRLPLDTSALRPLRAAVPPATAEAEDLPVIVVRVGRHPTHERVVFDWARPVAYRVERTERELAVEFDGKARLDLTNFQRRLAPGFAAPTASVTERGARFVWAVPAGAAIRDFTIGNRIVLDIASPAQIAQTGANERTKETSEPDPAATEKAATTPAVADAGLPVIRVRVGRHPTHERVVFDWESPVEYRVERMEREVAVLFDGKARLDLTNFQRRLAPGFAAPTASVTERGARFVWAVPPDAAIRDFTIGNRIVLDIAPPAKTTDQSAWIAAQSTSRLANTTKADRATTVEAPILKPAPVIPVLIDPLDPLVLLDPLEREAVELDSVAAGKLPKATLAQGISLASLDGPVMPEHELAEQRAGFVTRIGLEISVGFELASFVDGVMVARTLFNLPDNWSSNAPDATFTRSFTLVNNSSAPTITGHLPPGVTQVIHEMTLGGPVFTVLNTRDGAEISNVLSMAVTISDPGQLVSVHRIGMLRKARRAMDSILRDAVLFSLPR